VFLARHAIRRLDDEILNGKFVVAWPVNDAVLIVIGLRRATHGRTDVATASMEATVNRAAMV
jgi:hypothetical protein